MTLSILFTSVVVVRAVWRKYWPEKSLFLCLLLALKLTGFTPATQYTWVLTVFIKSTNIIHVYTSIDCYSSLPALPLWARHLRNCLIDQTLLCDGEVIVLAFLIFHTAAHNHPLSLSSYPLCGFLHLISESIILYIFNVPICFFQSLLL